MFCKDEDHSALRFFVTETQVPNKIQKRLKQTGDCVLPGIVLEEGESNLDIFYSSEQVRPNTPVNVLMGVENTPKSDCIKFEKNCVKVVTNSPVFAFKL